MNKHVKYFLKVAILMSVIIAPVLTLFIITENIANQYEKTYLAEFNDKYARLNQTNEKKIVFVGGSSLPFGLRSDLIEEQLPEYKVVNYGLYATLGTKFMMDTSRSNINKGDIVILTPEINEQTYSLYFNPQVVLQACDGFSSCYKYLPINDNLKLFYNYYKYCSEKLRYSIDKNAPDPVGIYRHDSFNEYGDIGVDRPNNIMVNGVDSTMKIIISESLLNNEFVDYINNYVDYVKTKKARVYFNFSPCNELAIYSSNASIESFQNSIDLVLKCERLTSIKECIMDYRYFYDTNFHLNSIGATNYTNMLIKNLKRVVEIDDEEEWHDTSEILPPPSQDESEYSDSTPPESGVDFKDYKGGSNIDFVDCFEYKLVGSSYQIMCVKSDYKKMEDVILPSTYNGKNVTTISKNAFYGCTKLKNIYIGKTYKVFEEKAFNGCINLNGIFLYVMDGNTLSPASSGLMDGTSRDAKIFIPTGANYSSGYTWSNYSGYFAYFTLGE